MYGAIQLLCVDCSIRVSDCFIRVSQSNSGIILDSFTPSVFLQLFKHNSRIPIAKHICMQLPPICTDCDAKANIMCIYACAYTFAILNGTIYHQEFISAARLYHRHMLVHVLQQKNTTDCII